MDDSKATVCIRLVDGRNICMRYNQAERALAARRIMLGQMSNGEPLQHFTGEIPARDVSAIEILAE